VDKEIRNRIQRATQAARALLEREYAEQLEGMFDIRLDGTFRLSQGGILMPRNGSCAPSLWRRWSTWAQAG
jgi:hypothetical protein